MLAVENTRLSNRISAIALLLDPFRYGPRYAQSGSIPPTCMACIITVG